jgi:hypothetical protein
VSPEAVAPRATEPVAREELDRGRHADPRPPSPYSPTALAAFSRNREASRDVPAKHCRSPVARLVGDDALCDPGSSSRGRKAGAQRVTGYLARVEPGTGGAALHHKGHGRAAESCRADMAMAVHGAKGGSLGDA